MHRYFKRSEFACPCGECTCDTVDYDLLRILIKARELLGPIIIDSGHRCKEYNASEKIDGAVNSYHLIGKAADIRVRNYSPGEVQGYFRRTYPSKYGLGVYKTFTHIDVRNGKGRWEG